ncbi:MAG: DUF4349 domain-containing protein [Chloroflexota bacterium]
MLKRTLFALTIIALILTACAAKSEYDAASPVLMEMPETFGGDYMEEMTIERSMDVDDQGFTANAISGSDATVERMVIKNADLSIVVEDPAQSMDGIATMAEGMGGFVVTSNLWQNTIASGITVPHASITVRVPAERLDEALDEIKSGAGEVLRENVSGQDVTREYTDLRSRLRNLEAAEAQLMEIMENATRTEDVLDVYNNLVNVREQIELIKGQMQYYEQAAALSSVSVDITADDAMQPWKIGNWQPVGVAKDAIEVLINTLQWLGDMVIWVVLCVLPVGIIIGIPLYFTWRGVSRLRKRRKAEKEVAASPKEE